MKDTIFQTVIKELGVPKIVEICGVSHTTVYAWVNLKSAPSPWEAHLLIKATSGLLSFEKIYRPYVDELEKTENQLKLPL
jgi:hypothetical protein